MHQSIETKYRPEDFDEVIGQKVVVKSLQNAIEKRLGTTFLFTGPSGTGKTTLARLAATALGCLPADLEEIDAATKTGIEDMREVTGALMYRPLGTGGVKAIIVDEVHALSKAAMQSLLKVLEDPPSWVFWFLCTTEPTKVPKAIQTRCLSYQLKEVGVDDLIDLLATTEEAKDIDDGILALCAKEAGGSPRQALSNLGVCVTAENRKEAAELLRSAAETKEAFELARVLFNGASWNEVRELLSRLKETSPESVRHVVRAYMTKVLLDSQKKVDTEIALAILDAFSIPFNSFDGMSPLVLACAKLCWGSK
jgi:DNA polymerase-3 subunit gamma/tau